MSAAAVYKRRAYNSRRATVAAWLDAILRLLLVNAKDAPVRVPAHIFGSHCAPPPSTQI